MNLTKKLTYHMRYQTTITRLKLILNVSFSVLVCFQLNLLLCIPGKIFMSVVTLLKEKL